MPQIEWPLACDEATVDKLRAKHEISLEEVEEAIFDDAPHYRRGRSDMLLVFGQTLAGRYLFVVLGKNRGRGKFKVVTARTMQEAERQYYNAQRGKR